MTALSGRERLWVLYIQLLASSIRSTFSSIALTVSTGAAVFLIYATLAQTHTWISAIGSLLAFAISLTWLISGKYASSEYAGPARDRGKALAAVGQRLFHPELRSSDYVRYEMGEVATISPEQVEMQLSALLHELEAEVFAPNYLTGPTKA